MSNSVRMRTVLGFALLFSTCLRAQEPRPPRDGPESPPDGDRVAPLIAQLGSRQFEEREAATQALDALGPAALELLRKALASSDAEVRRRAEKLVRTIEGRLESARALEPTRLRLVYREKPVADALEDLARRTGLRIQLDGDSKKLPGRKVTLDTGETTLWEALAEFCRKAGLSERAPRPARSWTTGIATGDWFPCGNFTTWPNGPRAR